MILNFSNDMYFLMQFRFIACFCFQKGDESDSI